MLYYFDEMGNTFIMMHKSRSKYDSSFIPSSFIGNVSSRVYEEDCEFADPAGSFRSLKRFKNNCSNFGALLEKSDVKLVKWEELNVSPIHPSLALVVKCNWSMSSS